MDFYRPPTSQGALDALGAVYRAIRALRFYPKGHPARRKMLDLAHAAMLQLLDGNSLMLACGSTGFSFPDGEFLKDPSGLSSALSFELFIRRVLKITFCPDLFREDLLDLSRILCLPPEQVKLSGGVDTLMIEHGVRSIWVNEFDLLAINGRRRQVELTGMIPPGIDDSEEASDLLPDQPALLHDEQPVEQQLLSLLGRLAACDDDDTYLILARQAISCAETLLSRRQPQALLSLAELLASHADLPIRSDSMRECARFALEQICQNEELRTLVIARAGEDEAISPHILLAVLRVGNEAAIKAAIEQMAKTTNLKARKMLSTSLGKLGDGAVPVLLELMQDSRWFITRNICAILGFIGNHDALPALTSCLHHADLRVRKEAVRSLALVGGHEAEGAVLRILRTADTALYPQAIASLGGMKSRHALIELMKIVCTRDMFLKTLSLKIDALAAIALIGDRQVTPVLLQVLEERYLLAAARGRQFKIAIVNCLGRLGDSRAIPQLGKLATESGTLGSACADALAQIQKHEGTSYGIS
jgi:HEAT repeat protein